MNLTARQREQEFERQYNGTFSSGALKRYPGAALVCEVVNTIDRHCDGKVTHTAGESPDLFYLCERCAKNAAAGAYGEKNTHIEKLRL